MLRLLYKKSLKNALLIGIFALVAVALAIILWPNTILQFISNNPNLLRAADVKNITFTNLLYITRHIFNFLVMTFFSFITYNQIIIIIGAVLVLGIIILFSTQQNKKFWIKMFTIPLLAETLASLLVISFITIPVMGDQRYLLFVFPIMCILIGKLFDKIPAKWLYVTLLCLIICMSIGKFFPPAAPFSNDILEDKYVITVTDSETKNYLTNINIDGNLLMSYGKFKKMAQVLDNYSTLQQLIDSVPQNEGIVIYSPTSYNEVADKLQAYGIKTIVHDKYMFEVVR